MGKKLGRQDIPTSAPAVLEHTVFLALYIKLRPIQETLSFHSVFSVKVSLFSIHLIHPSDKLEGLWKVWWLKALVTK